MDYKEHIQRVMAGEKGLNPYIDQMSIQVTSVHQGHCQMLMPVRDDFFQGAGVLQGGMIGALADEAMAYAMMDEILPNQIIATVDIAHTHLAPVFKGQLRAEAELIKKGSRMGFLECRVFDDNDKIVLSSHASFMILPKKN